ncbi:nuclear transport factor 2 family protein [Desulfovibrio inopinatus]|uniref:nuclear transport factor 2 family protein n=1 Tax=Desulfovibrio inopinatus TaxID=102109 RepID=UPI0004269296|nr:nuclear transport factor 2 family protein [Desulfovibrio inopinatus]
MIDTQEGFHKYLHDFNSGNFYDFVPKYYAEDAIFEKTGYTIHGAQNLADHFSQVLSAVVKEEITLIHYIKKDNLVAVELQIELIAIKDGFYIKDRKKGEKEIFYDTGFYNIENNKIVHARVYRRFTDRDTIDLAKMYGKE